MNISPKRSIIHTAHTKQYKDQIRPKQIKAKPKKETKTKTMKDKKKGQKDRSQNKI